MKKKTKILVTGVAGFIASKICKKLIKKNYIVYGVDDLSTGNQKNIPQKVKFYKFDLSNYNNFKILPKCDYIFHLAGQSSGDISFDDPVLDIKKNTISTINLINYGIKSKTKKIIYASSMSIYGDYKIPKYSENLIPDPKSCYGVSKYMSENYLKIFSKKIDYVIFRMFNVYGPGQDLKNLRQGMVSIYLAQALRNKKIVVRGSLNRVRDFIYIDDVVDVWVKSLSKNIKNETFNLSTGKATSVKNLLNYIIKLIPGTVILKRNSTRGDQLKSVGNIKKLNRIFKKNFLPIQDGLKLFVKSIKI